MRAVITVIGKDTVGILAAITTLCAKHGVNVIEVTQSVLQELFAMIMLVDMKDIDCDFGAFAAELKEKGVEMNLDIHTMHEDVFNSMHHV